MKLDIEKLTEVSKAHGGKDARHIIRAVAEAAMRQIQSMGGNARRDSLTSARRAEIARMGGIAKEKKRAAAAATAVVRNEVE